MHSFLLLVRFTFFFSILGFVIADKSSRYCHASFFVKAFVIMSAIFLLNALLVWANWGAYKGLLVQR